MGLAIADIKRFVNDGLTPINALIGAPSDAANKNGSLHAKSAYLVSKVDDMSTKINNIQAGISSIGGEKHYEPADINNIESVIFSSTAELPRNVSGYAYEYFMMSKVFYPKYDGFVNVNITLDVQDGGDRTGFYSVVNTYDFFHGAQIFSGISTEENFYGAAENLSFKYIFTSLGKNVCLEKLLDSPDVSTYVRHSGTVMYSDNIFILPGYNIYFAGSLSKLNTAKSISKKIFVKKGFPVRAYFTPYNDIVNNKFRGVFDIYAQEVA